MNRDDGSNALGAGKPPDLDESWWSAIMAEEEKQAQELVERSAPEPDRRVTHPGSPEDWSWAKELYQKDDVVELPIIGFNRGGLLVEARGLRGFVPVSHLVAVDPSFSEQERNAALEAMVDKKVALKVIEYDPDRGRLVFSERAALAGPGRRVELLTRLNPGDRVCGKVTNITRFGVFIDLGGVEGLIHVSELSWGRVRHPEDVIECGEELEVQVLSVDRDQDRVALSLKELLPDPWQEVEKRYEVGQTIEGEVTNVVKFGAFVGIEEGLEGLIHVSEMGDGNFLHPRNVVNEGEIVRVRIIHIDAEDRRLGLSLRAVPSIGGEAGAESESTEAEPSEAFPAL
ncbi:MAG: S1 RNA-binding domain-containing protein [Anaerolineales bacterium]|nr:S1 RNA-binding domain-containing protein [Anaerolineales bacterium]